MNLATVTALGALAPVSSARRRARDASRASIRRRVATSSASSSVSSEEPSEEKTVVAPTPDGLSPSREEPGDGEKSPSSNVPEMSPPASEAANAAARSATADERRVTEFVSSSAEEPSSDGGGSFRAAPDEPDERPASDEPPASSSSANAASSNSNSSSPANPAPLASASHGALGLNVHWLAGPNSPPRSAEAASSLARASAAFRFPASAAAFALLAAVSRRSVITASATSLVRRAVADARAFAHRALFAAAIFLRVDADLARPLWRAADSSDRRAEEEEAGDASLAAKASFAAKASASAAARLRAAARSARVPKTLGSSGRRSDASTASGARSGRSVSGDDAFGTTLSTPWGWMRATPVRASSSAARRQRRLATPRASPGTGAFARLEPFGRPRRRF